MPQDPNTQPQDSQEQGVITLFSPSGKSLQVKGSEAYKEAIKQGWSRKDTTGHPGRGGFSGVMPPQQQPQSGTGAGSRFTSSMLQGADTFHEPPADIQTRGWGKTVDVLEDAFNAREIGQKVGKGDIAGAVGMQIGTFLGGEGMAHGLGMAGEALGKTPVGKAALKSLNSASTRAAVTARAMGSGITSQMAYAGEKLIQPVYEALNKRFAPLHDALGKKIIALSPRAEQLIRAIHELEPDVAEHVGGLIKDTGTEVRKVATKAEESTAKEGTAKTVGSDASVKMAGSAAGAKRDTEIMARLKKEHPDWSISKRLKEAAEISKKMRATEAESTVAKESERTTETSKQKKYGVRSALDYEEAKNLLSHLKSVASARGSGEMSRISQLATEIDTAIDKEAQKVGMSGLRKDSQALWGEMTALRNVAIREMKERTKVKQIVATVSSKAAKLFDDESKKEVPEEFVASARELYKKITGKNLPKEEQHAFRAGAKGAMQVGSAAAKYLPPISRAIISALSSGQQPQAPEGGGGI